MIAGENSRVIVYGHSTGIAGRLRSSIVVVIYGHCAGIVG